MGRKDEVEVFLILQAVRHLQLREAGVGLQCQTLISRDEK